MQICKVLANEKLYFLFSISLKKLWFSIKYWISTLFPAETSLIITTQLTLKLITKSPNLIISNLCILFSQSRSKESNILFFHWVKWDLFLFLYRFKAGGLTDYCLLGEALAKALQVSFEVKDLDYCYTSMDLFFFFCFWVLSDFIETSLASAFRQHNNHCGLGDFRFFQNKCVFKTWKLQKRACNN